MIDCKEKTQVAKFSNFTHKYCNDNVSKKNILTNLNLFFEL